MRVFTCDWCSVVLKERDDSRGGAHQLKIEDFIPWTTRLSKYGGPPYERTIDLCGKCLGDLRAFIGAKEAAAPEEVKLS